MKTRDTCMEDILVNEQDTSAKNCEMSAAHTKTDGLTTATDGHKDRIEFAFLLF